MLNKQILERFKVLSGNTVKGTIGPIYFIGTDVVSMHSNIILVSASGIEVDKPFKLPFDHLYKILSKQGDIKVDIQETSVVLSRKNTEYEIPMLPMTEQESMELKKWAETDYNKVIELKPEVIVSMQGAILGSKDDGKKPFYSMICFSNGTVLATTGATCFKSDNGLKTDFVVPRLFIQEAIRMNVNWYVVDDGVIVMGGDDFMISCRDHSESAAFPIERIIGFIRGFESNMELTFDDPSEMDDILVFSDQGDLSTITFEVKNGKLIFSSKNKFGRATKKKKIDQEGSIKFLAGVDVLFPVLKEGYTKIQFDNEKNLLLLSSDKIPGASILMVLVKEE